MITISVESDEEQWAIGTALVNGALAFGSWPFEVKRRYRAEMPSEHAGSNGGSAYAAGHGSVAIGGGAVGYGGSVMVPDFFVCPLRTCCATRRDQGHREGCGKDGR